MLTYDTLHCSAVDCQYTWGEWSQCSAQCGGGQRTRTQLVTVQGSNGGLSCLPRDQRRSETERCNTHTCSGGSSGSERFSCLGRCGSDDVQTCSCDDKCSDYDDCCNDFMDVCGVSSNARDPLQSCAGRCSRAVFSPMEKVAACWCDADCVGDKNCCHDFTQECPNLLPYAHTRSHAFIHVHTHHTHLHIYIYVYNTTILRYYTTCTATVKEWQRDWPWRCRYRLPAAAVAASSITPGHSEPWGAAASRSRGLSPSCQATTLHPWWT